MSDRRRCERRQQGWAYDAEAGHITHGGLCLSIEAWGIPANLYSCGNASTHQNFTYDDKAKHFSTEAPANTAKLYPAWLEATPPVGDEPQKVYVYRPGGAAPGFTWAATGGTISNPSTKQCLAARGEFLPPVKGVAGVQWWAKPLGKGKVAALLINGGGSNYTVRPKKLRLQLAILTAVRVQANISTAELNMTGHMPSDVSGMTVADVDTGEDVSSSLADGVFTTRSVGTLDSQFVVFTAA
eukprot:COSAG04_NODE_2173_length_4627_cov_7.913082_4_plen_241_part_00